MAFSGIPPDVPLSVLQSEPQCGCRETGLPPVIRLASGLPALRRANGTDTAGQTRPQVLQLTITLPSCNREPQCGCRETGLSPPGFRLASGLPPLRRATVRMPQHRPAHSSSTDDCAFRPATASRDADAVRQACPRFPPGERPSGTPASKKRRAKTKRRKNRKLADYEKLSKFAD